MAEELPKQPIKIDAKNMTIAKPDVILKAEFMTPEMFNMVRPKETLNIDKLPDTMMTLENFYPQTQQNQKFPAYVNKVIEAYNSGLRYKEFRNVLKRQAKKEQKAKENQIVISHNKTLVFD